MLNKLKKMMADVLPEVNLDEVNNDTRLVEDLHFDSLSIMMLAMKIEDEFDFVFEEPVTFKTVGEVINFLENLKK